MKWLLIAAMCLVGSVGWAPPASADCHTVVTVELVQGVEITKVHQVCSSASAPTANDLEGTTPAVNAAAGSDEACIGYALVEHVSPAICRDQDPRRRLTLADISTAFRALPLPAAQLQIQPVHLRTLVNLATDFYTVRPGLDRTLTLLGQHIQLRIRPARFTWDFGDGAGTSTTSPGAAYPDLIVTHRYSDAGTVHPSVAVSYTADYRLGAGPWQPVPGSATIQGAAVALRVEAAHPQLVASP